MPDLVAAVCAFLIVIFAIALIGLDERRERKRMESVVSEVSERKRTHL